MPCIVSLISFAVLIPLYAILHHYNKYSDEHRYYVHSELDNITMEDAMMSDGAMIAVLAITFLYSCIAYYFVYSFCKIMRNFEFNEIEFADAYAS